MASRLTDIPPQRMVDPEFYFTLVSFELKSPRLKASFFRVPIYPFEESEVFRGMFTLHLPTYAHLDGLNDEKPLILPGISAKDFRTFLKVLFPPAFGKKYEPTRDERNSILGLSHRYLFERIFDLTRYELEEVLDNPVAKLLAAKAYNIKSWLLPAHIEIVI